MELRPGLKDVRRPAALMHAYIVLSLLAGIRTEEARALRWQHVDLNGDPAATPPVAVWRSVRAHGETKTERSRRTLGLPVAAVQALRAWSDNQAGERLAAGDDWQDTGLVFTTHHGAALDAGNVRKMFKRICTEAGIGDSSSPPAPKSWTSSSQEPSPSPARQPPRTCTSQPPICSDLTGARSPGPAGDGHPADLVAITQCDHSSVVSSSLPNRRGSMPVRLRWQIRADRPVLCPPSCVSSVVRPARHLVTVPVKSGMDYPVEAVAGSAALRGGRLPAASGMRCRSRTCMR
jgi:hypothetical protein